jgi:hypothetical protein
MNTTVLTLCYTDPDKNDVNLAGLVGYLGLDHKFVRPDELSVLLEDSKDKRITCVALSAATLEAIHRNASFAGFLEKLLANVSFLFLYGFSSGAPTYDGLRPLTGGIIQSVSSLSADNLSYSVSEQYRDVSRQFSGLTFGPVNSQSDFVFDTGKVAHGVDVIVSIDNRPMFIRAKQGSCNIFALAVGKILDLQEMENRPITAARHFSALAPALMVLKHIFGDACWHPVAGQACLTIDDPLLHERYGFLNFRLLLETMKKDGFSTTLAFIPWNYRRTQPRVAALFKENPDKLSICVHGCDHTAGEFGLTDFSKANTKVKIATKKMAAHRELTGLGFDPVMVFPQGVFSTIALKALKCNKFTAAVNSGVFPADSHVGLSILDRLQPSVMSWESFPLFHRRYPVTVADFAFDLFLGKPALIVVHHDDFRDGYEAISGFIKKLNALDSDIRWQGLGEIVRRSYWVKRESDTHVFVRMSSHALLIDNETANTVRYSISKCETNNVPLDGVYVNGLPVATVMAGQFLEFEVDVEAQASVDVTVMYRNPDPGSGKEAGLRERAKILVRRYLSEFRDNYVSKSRFLQALTKRIVRVLR